ncbi:enoyl-CoA hydratase/isomerase family protein [Mycobacterium xenopi 3993]|nr:enoyl-CoA hydratase/isomerase family protein [Mycobacterium xenopi 3993]
MNLDYDGKIAVLDLGDNENRFSPEFLDEFDAHLDEVVGGGAQGLVTTAAGKFYTNGLDLDWLMAHGDQTQWYVHRVQGLLARVLTLPTPTAAALPGHAFGAGAMLALAHDFRVMRADRGFFCFPEVDIRIPFTPGMAALIQAKLTPQAAVASMTTGAGSAGRTPRRSASSTLPRARALSRPPPSSSSGRSKARIPEPWARSRTRCTARSSRRSRTPSPSRHTLAGCAV